MMYELGFQVLREEPLANTDHTFRYVYRVPKRNGADVLKSMLDLK
jgi:hypothetical protein